MVTDSQRKIFEAQIREIYGRVMWANKTQEKCADIIHKRHKTIKIIQIFLSALTTTGVLIAVFGNNTTIGVLTALISATLFGLNTYTKDYDLGEITQKHSMAAAELWNIRESYLSLLVDIVADNISISQINEKRELLQKKLYNIYAGSPRTINKAYIEASKGLKINEEMTFSDDEIDMLLPIELRKNK